MPEPRSGERAAEMDRSGQPYAALLRYLGTEIRLWNKLKAATVFHQLAEYGEGLVSVLRADQVPNEPAARVMVRIRYCNGAILDLTAQQFVEQHAYIELPDAILTTVLGGANPASRPVYLSSATSSPGPGCGAVGRVREAGEVDPRADSEDGAATRRGADMTCEGLSSLAQMHGPSEATAGQASGITGRTADLRGKEGGRVGASDSNTVAPSAEAQLGPDADEKPYRLSPEERAADRQLAAAKRRAEIEAVIKRRSIRRLVHFTRMENLPSIFEHGLLPRDRAKKLSPCPLFTDSRRLDGRESALCLSITDPNYRMLCRQHDKSPTEMRKWVVLSVLPDVLATHRCAFFQQNAASTEYREVLSVYFEAPQKLEVMFAENVDGVARSGLGLQANQTTDPQAEVLIFDPIPPVMIQRVMVCDRQSRELVIAQDLPVEVVVCPEVFRQRPDWKAWQKRPAQE